MFHFYVFENSEKKHDVIEKRPAFLECINVTDIGSVLFRWEYDPKQTQCEEERVCITSVENLYEVLKIQNIRKRVNRKEPLLTEVFGRIYDGLYQNAGKKGNSKLIAVPESIEFLFRALF